MGKRSKFLRHARDHYDTPYKAVLPLLPHLQDNTKFYEPCGGNGALIRHLEQFGHLCVGASDIEPQDNKIIKKSAFQLCENDLLDADVIITNPPWDRDILHPMMQQFILLNKPAWLLFDADWAYTKQSKDLLHHVSLIVVIGRVKWIEDSKYTGKDNSCWYLLQPSKTKTQFCNW